MSDSLRHPIPQRYEGRHRAHRGRREGTEEAYEAPKVPPKGRLKVKLEKFAFNFVEFTGLQLSLFGERRPPPSRDRKHRAKPDEHRHHREENRRPKGRHRSPNKSRRKRTNVSNHPRPQAYPFGTLQPTKPGSSRSQASSHTAVEDLYDARVDARNVPDTGSDHIVTLSHSDDDCDGLSVDVKCHPSGSGDAHERDVSETLAGLDINQKKDIDIIAPSNPCGGRNNDINLPLSSPEPAGNKDLDVGTPSNLDGELPVGFHDTRPHSQKLPTTAINVDTLRGADDYDGLSADVSPSPSDSGRNHGGHVSKALSGLEIDHNEDLEVAALSDPEKEMTASLRRPRPRSPGLLTRAFRDTSAVPNKGSPKDHCDTSPPLHAILDPDHTDTTAELDEDCGGDRGGDQHGTPSSSDEASFLDKTSPLDEIAPLAETSALDTTSPLDETSDRDEDEDSDLEPGSSDSAGDQEEGGFQVTASLSQVAKTDLGDASPNSDGNWDAPLSASPLHPGEDHEVEDTPDAAIRPEHSADSDLGDTSSNFEDGDLATGDSHGLIDISSENEEEVDDEDRDDDEGYFSASRASLEKPEITSITAPVVIPPSQEDTTGSGDSKTECSASHNASETESPGSPRRRPSSLVNLPDYLFVGSFVRRKSGHDPHPYLIIRIELDEDGKICIWACICTSRPQYDKLEQQYRDSDQEEKNFIYLGGEKVNPKGFKSDGLKLPTKPDLEIQGSKMRYFTYLELDEYGPFEPGDFKRLSGGPRQLTSSDLDEVLNQCQLHGCKKSPLGASPSRNRECSR